MFCTDVHSAIPVCAQNREAQGKAKFTFVHAESVAFSQVTLCLHVLRDLDTCKQMQLQSRDEIPTGSRKMRELTLRQF